MSMPVGAPPPPHLTGFSTALESQSRVLPSSPHWAFESRILPSPPSKIFLEMLNKRSSVQGHMPVNYKTPNLSRRCSRKCPELVQKMQQKMPRTCPEDAAGFGKCQRINKSRSCNPMN
ncbi:uncharacterized protein LOC122004058 [Zingiber officinale]|uniref:uncharacterized protein LOC122004058 n=1 Tax=Zingiber officinale TaxID=94328 RepID=UPI001C4B713C|nr:uncharacterized protein LOC122004058 [Zingiber officinale]